MLMPVQTSGDKAPLFFVHGPHGVMPMGRTLARVLGSEQPLYAIHANGINGRSPAIDSVNDMVRAYVEEIREARPSGPVVIGGMGDGSLAAIEIARELHNSGRQVGPVVLADPPAAPGKQTIPSEVGPQIERQLHGRVRQNLSAYASVPENDLPFDSHDPQQLHLAVAAGVASMLAFDRHVPSVFSGPAQLILCARAAAGFFHPQMPWHKLLSGPRMVHILPWDPIELFRAGREHVARGIKFLLGEALTLETVSERQELDAPRIEHMARTIDRLVAGRAR
jgi:thioesterase domain-containing protein